MVAMVRAVRTGIVVGVGRIAQAIRGGTTDLLRVRRLVSPTLRILNEAQPFSYLTGRN